MLNGAELDAVVDCHDDGPPAWCRSGETTLVKTTVIAMQVTSVKHMGPKI